MPGGNGWEEYQRLVLSELTRLDTEMRDLRRIVWGLVVGLLLTLLGVIANLVIALSRHST